MELISIGIAAGALVAAVIALVLGEVRAGAARRDANDYNDVEWVVERGFSDGHVTLLNNGLDDARNVRVRVFHDHMQYLETFNRVGPTEPETVAVPSLEHLWSDYRLRSSAGDDVIIATLGIRIAWESSRGKKEVVSFSAQIRSAG